MPKLPEKAPYPPLRSVRRFCLECQGGMARYVRECDDESCVLRSWRLPESSFEGGDDGDGNGSEAGRTVLRGIRRHCLVCAGDRREVRACEADSCPLWAYRFGVLPGTWLRVTRRFRAPKSLMLPGLEGLGKKKK